MRPAHGWGPRRNSWTCAGPDAADDQGGAPSHPRRPSRTAARRGGAASPAAAPATTGTASAGTCAAAGGGAPAAHRSGAASPRRTADPALSRGGRARAPIARRARMALPPAPGMSGWRPRTPGVLSCD
eukprot:gene14822-biopygen5379